MEISKEFVLETHKAACSDWKRKIEEQFPELFETKLEVGKWYKMPNSLGSKFYKGKFMVCFMGYGEDKSFGFDGMGCWSNKLTVYQHDNTSDFILATPEEVEDMLLKEAEKRGFKEGVTFLSSSGMVRTAKGDLKYGWLRKDNLHFADSEGLIYNKGKWAEIIDTNSELKQEIERLQKELDELKLKVK